MPGASGRREAPLLFVAEAEACRPHGGQWPEGVTSPRRSGVRGGGLELAALWWVMRQGEQRIQLCDKTSMDYTRALVNISQVVGGFSVQLITKKKHVLRLKSSLTDEFRVMKPNTL